MRLTLQPVHTLQHFFLKLEKKYYDLISCCLLCTLHVSFSNFAESNKNGKAIKIKKYKCEVEGRKERKNNNITHHTHLVFFFKMYHIFLI